MADTGSRLRGFREALARLDPGTQKLLFQGFSPEVRAALWQNRITDAQTTVSPAEAELLGELLQYATSEFYADGEKRDDVRDAILKVEERAKSVFEDFGVYNAITTQLGDDPCKTVVIPRAAGDPPCACSSAFSRGISGSGNDCAALTECAAGNCAEDWPGCGALFAWTCDGLCTGSF